MQNKTINKPGKTISLSNLPNIIIAVVLIVGAGAVYGLIGYLFFGIKENVTPIIQAPVVFENDEDEISDWKVYRNEEFGFEIKYPENWYFSRDKQAERKPDYNLHIGFVENSEILSQSASYPQGCAFLFKPACYS